MSTSASKQVGDHRAVKVFANADAAEKWFEENDPGGMAFEYEVMGLPGQRLNFGVGGAS
jgi:hypothetical protein